MGSSVSKPVVNNNNNEQKILTNVVSTSAVTETTSSSSTTTTASSSSSSSSTNTSSSNDGCPMHNSDGSYSWDLSALWSPKFPHGPNGNRPLDAEQVEQAKLGNNNINNQNVAASGIDGCPVKHDNNSSINKSTTVSDGCPVKHDGGAVPQYNVYGQIVDSNKMPKANVNQLPAPGQSVPLSTERVSSSIPKGGGANSAQTWTYPSPQQFYNALARKGKIDTKDNVDEQSMESVVALHNHMNEKTWRKVCEWEEVLNPSSTTKPKLLKFQGRPTDLSPKARFKHYAFGHPLPYDRHDWVIIRNDGHTVRYVIDYYYDESRAKETSDSAKPKLHEQGGSESLLVDVRPAVDDPFLGFHRLVTMPLAMYRQATPFQTLPWTPTQKMMSQLSESVQVWEDNVKQGLANEKSAGMAATANDEGITDQNVIPILSKSDSQDLMIAFDKMQRSCKQQQNAVQTCNDDESCARSSMDLSICMAQFVCPLQHMALLKTLEKDDGEDEMIESALLRMNECVMVKNKQNAQTATTYPELLVETRKG